MPVNSFENYPMSWIPDKKKISAPMYLSIADILEQDILNGKLPANTKLPPQRELADYLDINLSTITRAFKLCENKGLIYANIGQGTFVSPNTAALTLSMAEDSDIELSVIKPYYQFNHLVSETAKNILQKNDSHHLFEFHSTSGTLYHKQTARKWLQNFKVNVPLENIILTSGTQNSLTIALLALFHSGDKIITDSFTYSNFISLARQLNIQLISIMSDKEGMIPDLLEKQCKQASIKGIFLMPSCNNPTGIVMSAERKKEISGIIEKYHLILIEDDTYGFISTTSEMPLQAIIPENTVYLHSMSKSLSAGLRSAYMVIPDCLLKAFLTTANNVNLKIPLLNAEITSELITNGTAEKIIQQKKIQSLERNNVYKKYFPDNISSNKYSFFQWLPLPAQCNGYQIEMQAKDKRVQIFCSDRFSVGKTELSAIRIATCSPTSVEQLEKGLQIIQQLLTKNQQYREQNSFIV